MTPVLVDTSVWRRHFAGRLTAEQNSWMGGLLDEDAAIRMHPWVTGELVLGGLSAEQEALLNLLPRASEVVWHEVLGLIRSRKLARRGIGLVDAQLLASALVDSARLWTVDKSLAVIATELQVRFDGDLR